MPQQYEEAYVELKDNKVMYATLSRLIKMLLPINRQEENIYTELSNHQISFGDILSKFCDECSDDTLGKLACFYVFLARMQEDEDKYFLAMLEEKDLRLSSILLGNCLVEIYNKLNKEEIDGKDFREILKILKAGFKERMNLLKEVNVAAIQVANSALNDELKECLLVNYTSSLLTQNEHPIGFLYYLNIIEEHSINDFENYNAFREFLESHELLIKDFLLDRKQNTTSESIKEYLHYLADDQERLITLLSLGNRPDLNSTKGPEAPSSFNSEAKLVLQLLKLDARARKEEIKTMRCSLGM